MIVPTLGVRTTEPLIGIGTPAARTLQWCGSSSREHHGNTDHRNRPELHGSPPHSPEGEHVASAVDPGRALRGSGPMSCRRYPTGCCPSGRRALRGNTWGTRVRLAHLLDATDVLVGLAEPRHEAHRRDQR